MRFLRRLVLFTCALGLMCLAGWWLGGTALALPAAIAGVGSFVLAIG